MTTLDTYTVLNDGWQARGKRFAQAVPGGLAVTLLLVLGMQHLIATDPVTVPEPIVWRVPDPIIEDREPPPIERDRPKKLPPAEVLPDLPDFTVALNTEVELGIEHLHDVPTVATGIDNYAGNEPVPTVLVQPDYPARALARGINGYVDVRFDVTAMGTTTNITVIGAEPTGVFEQAARRAVQKWKFQPPRKDGQAYPFAGMQQRITFVMEK